MKGKGLKLAAALLAALVLLALVVLLLRLMVRMIAGGTEYLLGAVGGEPVQTEVWALPEGDALPAEVFEDETDFDAPEEETAPVEDAPLITVPVEQTSEELAEEEKARHE